MTTPAKTCCTQLLPVSEHQGVSSSIVLGVELGYFQLSSGGRGANLSSALVERSESSSCVEEPHKKFDFVVRLDSLSPLCSLPWQPEPYRRVCKLDSRYGHRTFSNLVGQSGSRKHAPLLAADASRHPVAQQVRFSIAACFRQNVRFAAARLPHLLARPGLPR